MAYEQGAVNFHLAGRARRRYLDRGEAEAVLQASQIGAVVIVDDPWGRSLADRSELEFHGTLWVLGQFHKLALLSSTEIRNCVTSLLRRGIRLPTSAVNEFLSSIGERPV